MTLTKADLTDNLAHKFGLSKHAAKDLVDQLFEEVRSALSNGDEVKLSGFGNFAVRNKKPRPGRNPRTGETVEVTARRVVTFHPGQKLRTVVAQFAGEPELD